MDLVAKHKRLRGHTFLQGASLEDDYKMRCTLSTHLSRVFHIEAARFSERSGQQEHCLFPTSRAASQFTGEHGVVVSWCTRRKLQAMFQAIGRWWLSLDPK